MKTRRFLIVTTILAICTRLAGATQADDTTITITGQNAGPTPFISQLTLSASDTSVLKNIQFTITPKSGSVTRPLSATYSHDYLVGRGFLDADTGEIFLFVWGLYDDFTNTVTLTYSFNDGSSKQDTTTVTTAAFDDPCGYKNPTVLQARTDSTSLSYDYILVKDSCDEFSPAILDTDGALRWVGPGGFSQAPTAFFDNAIYINQGPTLSRIELDGTVTFLHDYTDIGVTGLHHNIDRGKVGLILDVNTADFVESINLEVDAAGNILKMWNLADIISQAMIAGGDDPSQFVFPLEPDPGDWFHNNGVTYNRADDSLIVSSRENFLICLDYETLAIKWILGDPTKKWHQFPSLAKFALDLAPDSLPPIGQHAPSITFDQDIMVLDNGYGSLFQTPPGVTRTYASPRKYQLDLGANLATEVWNYEMDQMINSPICGSIYEDAPLNYVIDYAFVGGFAAENPTAQLLGLDAAGNKVFYYQYPTVFCNTAYNSQPLHLESTKFPTVGPQTLNISSRAAVGEDDDALIEGFIITGSTPKTLVLRAIGPSLEDTGVAGALADPILSVYDSAGALVTTNDNWQDDDQADAISAAGLAPSDPLEAATLQTLSPGAYTVVVRGQASTTGVALVEAYDLSPQADSVLGNVSARAAVGTDANVLISGFIVGDVGSTTTVIRAIGPSLGSVLDGPLSDPTLTVFDGNGSQIASNDNWEDDPNSADLQLNSLAPPDSAESALLLNLPAGAYTGIVMGADGGTGVGLVEVYDLQ